jgi:hypothetical protein
MADEPEDDGEYEVVDADADDEWEDVQYGDAVCWERPRKGKYNDNEMGVDKLARLARENEGRW